MPVVSRRIEPDATRSSTGGRKLDSQAALAQAQQEKAEAEAELSALTDKLASDAKRRPGRGLERYEVDEIKRRCSRLRQILGEVKRREKDLALKQQFNQEQKQRVAEVGIPPCPLSRAPTRALWLFLVSVTCRHDTQTRICVHACIDARAHPCTTHVLSRAHRGRGPSWSAILPRKNTLPSTGGEEEEGAGVWGLEHEGRGEVVWEPRWGRASG